MMRERCIGIALFIFLVSPVAWSKQQAVRKSTEKSTKELDFEGDVVEGVAKQPLDSLNQISDQDDSRNKNHLYRKRDSFQMENQEMVRELTETY